MSKPRITLVPVQVAELVRLRREVDAAQARLDAFVDLLKPSLEIKGGDIVPAKRKTIVGGKPRVLDTKLRIRSVTVYVDADDTGRISVECHGRHMLKDGTNTSQYMGSIGVTYNAEGKLISWHNCEENDPY